MERRPKISIAIPIHQMKNKDFFLGRCLNSIKEQSYKNYEIVITEDGKMAENTNSAIRQSTGELIKVLYMDDFLAHKDALKDIVEKFEKNVNWMVTGCINDKGQGEHYPYYNDKIHLGLNTIGSPSILTIRNGLNMYFDESMTWLLDCDFYKRMYEKYGNPLILRSINAVIGVGDHQMTNLLSDELKINEHKYMQTKYE